MVAVQLSYLAKYLEGECRGGGAVVGRANIEGGGECRGLILYTPTQRPPHTNILYIQKCPYMIRT